MQELLAHLQSRGLIQQTSSDELSKHLASPRSFYLGIDPTAESLHLGNLVGLIVATWLQRAGHTPIIIAGGATAMIGDPSGKSEERPLLSPDKIRANGKALQKTCAQLLDKGARFLNNLDWMASFSFIDFLRDVGKHFRLGPMLGKEMVRTRLESPAGLSYTEFSYQLLQGYDFVHLAKNEKVTLQIGGSDQWGNITAGIEAGRKMGALELFGLTHPLLLKSDGTKFGKSASGAIWLCSEKLPVFEFYQRLVRTEDADVIRMLKMLTFLPLDEIAIMENELGSKPGAAARCLAFEVTSFVHGEEAARKAEQAAKLSGAGKKTELSEEALELLVDELPTHEVPSRAILGCKIVDVLADLGLSASKGHTRRLIQNKGLYIGTKAVEDPMATFEAQDQIGPYFLVAMGKKNKVILRIV